MLIMASNDCGYEMGQLAGEFYPFLGHLYSPTAKRGPFRKTSWSGDNDVFGCAERNVDWPEAPWLHFVDWSAEQAERGFPPLWLLCPDVRYDRERTIERWHKYVGEIRARGLRPAFALQDDMTFDDVPSDDCMLFLGGSTEWKMKSLRPWCAKFPGRVHVGRVTEIKRLRECYEAGAVSVDGNGWWRKTNKPGQRVQREDLIAFLGVMKARAAADDAFSAKMRYYAELCA